MPLIRFKPRTDGNIGPIASDESLYSVHPFKKRPLPPPARPSFLYSPAEDTSDNEGEEDVADFASLLTKVNWRPFLSRMARRSALSIYEHYDVFGTVTADTTNYVYGEQGLKLTCVPGGVTAAHKSASLDLTTFDDAYSTESVASDLVQVWYHVDNPANFDRLRLRLTSNAAGVYTDYFETTITATPRKGWNAAYVAKSAFSTTGSPSWANITAVQVYGKSNANGTVNITVDDFRLVQASSAFKMSEVQDGEVELGSVKFRFEQATQCIRQIADILGATWYVDPDRVLHFSKPSSQAAPFALDETGGNFIPDSLAIRTDLTKIKNQVYVRGGEYPGGSTTYSQVADGSKANFLTPYKMKGVTVTVNAVAKTVGIDNIDDFTSYDCLYNFELRNLRFPSALSNGDVVAVSGTPMIPVLVKRSDAASIAEHGVFESVVLDNSIVTIQGGRDRAAAELQAFREGVTEGRFQTLTQGLRAGQQIDVDLPSWGIEDTFLVRQLTMKARSPSAFLYEADVVSTRTKGIMEWLFDQATAARKNVSADDNSPVDQVASVVETANISDVWVASLNNETEAVGVAESSQGDLNLGTLFVAGPHVPSGLSDTSRTFIVSGSRLG